MIIKPLQIKGAYEIQLIPQIDNRGFFMRTYDKLIFNKNNLAINLIQESHSYNKKAYTIRGFHFQYPPYAETKLVRPIQGIIIYAIVDLRKDSETFGKSVQIKLSSRKKNMIYVPKGCASCFCTLTNNCHLLYKMDNNFSPKYYDNIKWNDPDINISWPIKTPSEISERDANAQSLKVFIKKHKGLSI